MAHYSKIRESSKAVHTNSCFSPDDGSADIPDIDYVNNANVAVNGGLDGAYIPGADIDDEPDDQNGEINW